MRLKNIILILFASLILTLGLVSAVDFEPGGDINMRGLYEIKNATNVTALRFFGDGSGLTNLATENSSWNESYADTIYAPLGAGNASWNQSQADTLYSGIQWGYNQSLSIEAQNVNKTTGTNWLSWMLDAILDDAYSWIDSMFNGTATSYLFSDTSNVISFNESFLNGTIDNRVGILGGDNASWNETYADTLYSPIGSVGNASWNESYANTLYSGIQWAYNQTVSAFAYTDSASAELQSNISDVNSSLDSKFSDFNYNMSDGSFNSTYQDFAYNQTIPSNSYTDTSSNNLQSNISDVNSSLDSKYSDFNYNMSDGSFNITYQNFAYNQTTSSESYTDTASQNLQSNISDVNSSLDSKFNQYNYNQTIPANSYTDTSSGNLQTNISGVNNSGNIEGLGFNTTAKLNLIYINKSQEGNLNVNSSDFWDDLGTINGTQMEDNGGVLNILESWLTTFWDTIFGTKSTDDLTEGSTNLYDNKSWNQSLAGTLYADIQWAYNQTIAAFTYTDSASIELQSNISDVNSSLDAKMITTSDNLQTNISGVNTTNNIRGLVDDTYVEVAGDVMTGDLNMSNNTIETVLNITFTYGGYIRDNVTALIIGHT